MTVQVLNKVAYRGKVSPPNIFDPVVDSSESVLANPYPTFNYMRGYGQVVWSAKGNQWLVLGHYEASKMLRSKNYGKRIIENWKHPNLIMRGALNLIRKKTSSSMLIQDPPDHTRIRSLVASAFTPRAIHKLEGHIDKISNQLLDNLESKILEEGSADLISEYAFQLPVIVIAELLGVPIEDRAQFKAWSTKITQSLGGSACPMRALGSFMSMNSLRGYLKKVIKQKRMEPQDDLISSMVKAQSEEYSRLSDEELLANSVLMLIAGHETTVNLIGNGTYNFLKHPLELAKIQESPDLIPNAVEEILRYDPPVQIVRRVANEEMELGGQIINEGDALTVLIGACNRDPQRFSKPAKFDVERENIKHLTFGAGIHYCLGAELARTEARIAFRNLFRRIPTLKLAAQGYSYKGPLSLRGFKELWVTAG